MVAYELKTLENNLRTIKFGLKPVLYRESLGGALMPRLMKAILYGL